MILEVMGRDAGHIALHAGIAGGSDIILIPEIPYRFECLRKKIEHLQAQGKRHALVTVAEALTTQEGNPLVVEDMEGRRRYAGIGQYIGELIAKEMGIETRVTVLGHVQRGAAPIASDRILGSTFGVYAVDLINQGKFDCMVTWKNQKVTHMPILEAIDHYQKVDLDSPLIYTARGLGICLGDE
jgi:6-phosphofructokinase 1